MTVVIARDVATFSRFQAVQELHSPARASSGDDVVSE